MEFEFKASDIQKHTAAHILAAAVKRLYPNVKIGIGPVTKTGFFYDFELDKEITEKSFPLIEKNISQIIEEKLPMKQLIYSKADALNLLLQMGQVYKAELIKTVPEETVSFYRLGDEFLDPDRGPHLTNTGMVYKLVLTKLERVHWNNDTSRPSMYRIHGVVFTNETEYSKYQSLKEHSVSNSFEKVGKKIGVITENNPTVLTSKGAAMAESIWKYIKTNVARINAKPLVGNELFGHDIISNSYRQEFKEQIRSYKSLPSYYHTSIKSSQDIKLTNKSIYGVHSKIKVINDVNYLLDKIIDITNKITKESFSVDIRCSNLDEPLVKSISSLLQNKIVSHDKILSNAISDSVQLDFKVSNQLGVWKLIQLEVENDSQLQVMNSQGQLENVVTSKYTFFIDSIIEFLVRSNNSKLQFEFAPEQIRVIPHRKDQFEYANSLNLELLKLNYRSSVDLRSKSLRGKVRSAEKANIPFILVLGKKEELNKSASVRHNHVEVGLISLDNIIDFINEHANK